MVARSAILLVPLALLLAGCQSKPGDSLAGQEETQAQLAREYDPRVVNRGDEVSGVWRYRDGTPGRSYYLIVEAVTGDGKQLKMPIMSAETQKLRVVQTWGQRVPEETFNKIAAEKADDGIIEDAVIGHKLRGDVDPKFTLPVLPGAITEW